jgi:hypothetical protein
MADLETKQWITATVALVIAIYCACLLAYLLTPRSEQTIRGLAEAPGRTLQAAPTPRAARYFDI